MCNPLVDMDVPYKWSASWWILKTIIISVHLSATLTQHFVVFSSFYNKYWSCIVTSKYFATHDSLTLLISLDTLYCVFKNLSPPLCNSYPNIKTFSWKIHYFLNLSHLFNPF
jgi:hypothetical protein